jgi:immune inhibitor A
LNEKRSNNLVWWILGGTVVLLCCCLLFMVGTGGLLFGLLSTSSSQQGPAVVTVEVQLIPALTATPVSQLPTATPRSVTTPQPGSSLPAPATSRFLTEQQLQEVVVPARDLRTLAEGLRGTGPIPEVVWDTPPVYRVGDVDTFWISNEDTGQHQQIEARLVYMNDVLYMWVEEGVRHNLDRIQRSADKFANETYPTNRNFFGSEWSPGIDSDPRLHILHSVQLGERIAGYFSGADSVSNLAQPFSNQREMFYINIDNSEPNSEFYNGVLAHEFQHMIHWYQDKNEATWVNEGLSELAMQLNGYSTGGADQVFSQIPDTQLTAWSDDPNDRTQHYGAAYLFMAYFLQRFGNEMMQAVVAEDANSIDGFNNVVEQFGVSLTFDDVFADWVSANLLDDPNLADGQFGYQDLSPRPMARDQSLRRFPAQIESDVSQYGTDYVELRGAGDLAIDFRGATSTRLASNEPFSGQYAWWANREDDSDARLTRAFDLSQVDAATLDFWTWYDIEYDWDYGYVMASVDGGKTWTILRTEDTVDSTFGWAFTGCSGEPSVTEPGDLCNARWIQQSADLTPFTGNEEVLVRFQYITDDAVNYPGFFVDDVSITAINYFDDMESGAEGWFSEGWLLTDNILRQGWLLQLIELEDGQDPVITRVPVDENGLAQWTVENLGRRKHAILAISGLAPVTTEKALYEYTITQQ